ncbi:MAG TPA: peptidylprolyl isomerase [Anaeromyxobacteraceae bacterium]|nr:peptidylprolyl isomerase [Anaeromyxobacteraceae bacterium]
MTIPSLLVAAALAAAPGTVDRPPRGGPKPSAPDTSLPAPPPGAKPDATPIPPGPGRVLNRVAAIVNGEVVTLGEVEERAGYELRTAEAAPAADRDRLRVRALRGALDTIVADKLFAAQASQLGVEISDVEVDQTIDEIKRRNNLDDARLDAALAEQGMDRAAYRKALKRDLETARIISLRVRSRVKVTDEDVRNYWQTHQNEFRSGEEVKVRHIFVVAPSGAAEAEGARVRAEKALARVRAGDDFATVAREMSQAPSAAEGGDLGWLKRGTVQPEIEKVALALKPGQVSDLVRTRTGWQILKVEDRRGGQVRPFDDVKEEIRDRLANEQVETYRAQYVAELKKDAVIDVRMPELKDAATSPPPAAAKPASASRS